jgi:hypothetical protein
LEEHELDCEIGEDEESEEAIQTRAPVYLSPEMSPELTGIDEDLSPIEEWHASMFAHDAAVEDRRMPPDVIEHPDGHKSAKHVASFEREMSRLVLASRATETHDR